MLPGERSLLIHGGFPGAHLAPFLVLDEFGQLCEHVCTTPSVIDWRRLEPEGRGRGHEGEKPELLGYFWPEQSDEVNHLINFVLQGGACHEEDSLRSLAELFDVFGAYRLAILHVVGFVHGKKVEGASIGQIDCSKCFVCGYSYAAHLLPGGYRVISFPPMQFDGTKRAVFFDFAAPVGNYACRAYHHEVRGSRVAQRHHCCNGLDGFAQTHLVAKQDSLLMKDVFDTPFLVATQCAQKSLGVEALVLNRSGQVFRQAIELVAACGRARDNFLKGVYKGDAVVGKVLPSIVRLHVH